MLLFTGLVDVSLPLQNPVLQFALLLFIILFAPILLHRLRIPHLIGLLIAGAIIGPHGLHLMLRDSSIILFGTVGLLYIMFLAGLEIDLREFRKNSRKSLVFGLFTFLIPMGIGTVVSLWVLDLPMPSSILLASMFASHTLIAYPIVSKLGIVRNRAVTITIGGTLITDTLALLVLAAIVGLTTGQSGPGFWWQLAFFVLLFGVMVLLGFPLAARWFFRRYGDSISQYIFVLGMVFLGGFLAQAAGIEPIIGAFLAGLSLNRLIPSSSPLMNRIEFVGNALFIPFFLIGVGMLVDFRSFFSDVETIRVGLYMTAVATLSKFLAAWLTQKTFGFSPAERNVIFGLSNAQAAATLAAVLVGYQIVLNQPQIDAAALAGEVIAPVRLLDDRILNGTLLMILVTCTMASLSTQKGATAIALAEAGEEPSRLRDALERFLIPVDLVTNVEDMVAFSISLMSRRNKTGLYALHVLEEEPPDPSAEGKARKILQAAARTAASTDHFLHELLRYDIHPLNGIRHVIREHRITDLVLPLERDKALADSFVHQMADSPQAQATTTLFICKTVQPMATVRRHLVIVPEKAEREIGFLFWVGKLWNLARNTGSELHFFGPESTLEYFRELEARHPIGARFSVCVSWSDLPPILRDLQTDEQVIAILSRRDRPSYHPFMQRIPALLDQNVRHNNFVMVYPVQSALGGHTRIDMLNASLADVLDENLDRLDEFGHSIAGLFRKKNGES